MACKRDTGGPAIQFRERETQAGERDSGVTASQYRASESLESQRFTDGPARH
jgi:hypothetical protein